MTEVLAHKNERVRRVRKKKSAKLVERIDLSGDQVSEGSIGSESSKFNVNDYVHEISVQDQFENDLDYLLNSDSHPISNVQISQPIIQEPIKEEVEVETKKSRKGKLLKVSIADITKDIEDIQFSSDSEDEKVKVKEKEITPKKSKKSKKPKKEAETESPNSNGHTKNESREDPEPEPEPEPIDFEDFINEQEQVQIDRKKVKNKKRWNRRQKSRQLAKESAEQSDNIVTSTSASATPEPVVEQEQEQETDDSITPFNVRLRPTPKSNINSRYSENLPKIQPQRTIIGLSYRQILNIDPSDVKIKTIISSAASSKYASTALKFCMKHNQDLFDDVDKKRIFIILCINVALYEAVGFKNTAQIYPNVLELFGGYDEINLDTTRTKLTPSNRNVHQNNLDYSVLSYLGNILIWANHIQHEHHIRLLIKHYDVLSTSIIKQNFGGFHLWDKLIRESKGMNAKRWKHIVKFRQNFPFEEEKFVLILRYMNVVEST
ncbi:uncharacterized protein RJT21DRAFT_51656 [Scheffersomyces amazonensis]|uniref:uncharacterized protein n=1 Tax=Scheffersomyces amazonensis TaxID=1078765 RepID=UPI00315C52D9